MQWKKKEVEHKRQPMCVYMYECVCFVFNDNALSFSFYVAAELVAACLAA